MTARLVSVDHVETVSIVTLNRPERTNSLTPDLLTQLRTGLATASGRSTTRAVLLNAAGRHFSTGGDVQGFWDHRETLAGYAAEIVGLLNEVMLAMMRLAQPIVVAVQGRVTGGSLGLVLAGDLVVVTPDTSFQPWYSVLGFSPDGGWTALLPDIIGRQRVARILDRNRMVSGAEALEWGIAQELVPTAELATAATGMASEIAGRKTGSLTHGKRLPAGDLTQIGARLEAEREHFVHQIVTTEAREGIARFLGVT